MKAGATAVATMAAFAPVLHVSATRMNPVYMEYQVGDVSTVFPVLVASSATRINPNSFYVEYQVGGVSVPFCPHCVYHIQHESTPRVYVEYQVGGVSRQCPLFSPFLIGRMFLRESSWKYSANLYSWFLIGRTCLREPSWKYSSKLYSGSKKLRSTCSGNIRFIRQSLPLIS